MAENDDTAEKWLRLVADARLHDPVQRTTNSRLATGVVRQLPSAEFIRVLCDRIVAREDDSELAILVLRVLRPSAAFQEAIVRIARATETEVSAWWDILRASVTPADLPALTSAFLDAPEARQTYIAGAFVALVRDESHLLTDDEVGEIRAVLVAAPPAVMAVVEAGLGPEFLRADAGGP